jgi:hypothetical protein
MMIANSLAQSDKTTVPPVLREVHVLLHLLTLDWISILKSTVVNEQ